MVKIVEILSPLDSSERRRVIQASLTLLGDSEVKRNNKSDWSEEDNSGGGENLSKPAQTWMKQHNVSFEHLEQVFNFSQGDVDVIAADMPGKDLKTKTINCYVLQGLSKFLGSGELSFDDKDARSLCKKYGCFSESNHAAYVSGRGNIWTGTKESGWKLTSPGLKHAADLVKQLNG